MLFKVARKKIFFEQISDIPVRSLVTSFKHRLLALFKLVLLERKVSLSSFRIISKPADC